MGLDRQPKGCHYERVDTIFKALGDPVRLVIVDELTARQSQTLFEIVVRLVTNHGFTLSRQAVSKHLRILTECELVKQKHQGREIYYELEMGKMKEIDKWIEQVKKIWEDRFNQLDNLLLTIQAKEKK